MTRRISSATTRSAIVALGAPATPESQRKILAILESRLRNPRLQSVSLADGLTTIHYSFTALDSAGLGALEEAPAAVAPVRKTNVFYNRQGLLA